MSLDINERIHWYNEKTPIKLKTAFRGEGYSYYELFLVENGIELKSEKRTDYAPPWKKR
jgi:hypothetical protein